MIASNFFQASVSALRPCILKFYLALMTEFSITDPKVFSSRHTTVNVLTFGFLWMFIILLSSSYGRKGKTRKVQAVRWLTGSKTDVHVALILTKVHWLPVKQRIDF